MNILEVITSSFSSVFANKLRSILTMLGIIIGISSVIIITSLGDGFKAQTSESFEELGMNYIHVSYNWREPINYSDFFKLEDAEVLKIPQNVSYAVPFFYLEGSTFERNRTDRANLSINGVTADYRYAHHVDIAYGRFLMEADITNRSGVVVIDTNLANNVFGRDDVVGEKLEVSTYLGNREYDIIGVIQSPEVTSMFFFSSSDVFVPITTLMEYSGSDTVDGFYVTLYDFATASTSIAQMNMLLSSARGNQGENKYRFQNLRDQVSQIDDVIGQITMFVALVAAISLIVGGVGVMNIMLVTVTERTREIGIRKSLGATNGNIQFQFLVEAVILTVIGGILGIIIGYFGGVIISLTIPIKPFISPVIVLGTVLISMSIGIVFGVYPAGKAAKLDPIEALRYE